MPKSQLSEADNRLLAAKQSALALSEKILSEERLADMDGYRRRKRGGRKTAARKGGKRRKNGSLKDSLQSSLQDFQDALSGVSDNFGKNVARNVGEVLNPIAARDIGFAIAGGVMYLLIPPALNIATRRNFDHNGAGGVAVGLGGAALIGLLTGNVPFIAGAVAAFCAQAMYVLFDKQVLEKTTGVRLARWDVKADSTLADGQNSLSGGVYDNQPFPREIEINGVRATAYSYDDMLQQLEAGNSVKIMAEQGESVNHLADDGKNELFARKEYDSAGNAWGVLPNGLKLLLDADGEPALVNENFLAHDGVEVFPVDVDLKRIPQPFTPPTSAPKPPTTETIADRPTRRALAPPSRFGAANARTGRSPRRVR